VIESLRVRFLARARLRSHRRRVEDSRRVVAAALAACRSPYVALSGGKDSACVAHLVWEQRPDVPAVYFDAACAFPEVKDYLAQLKRQGRRLIRFQCRPFLEVLREFGLHSDAVEEATMRYTVHEPLQRLYHAFGYDAVFLGLRREESPGRAALLAARGQAFVRKSDGRLECNPIAWWSFDDVWAYLLAGEHPYCAAYDRLFDMGLPERSVRISYWAGETGRRWGRYEALRRGWPDLWRYFCEMIPEARNYA
jgi:3'-phosphoadenosine 5'-phosphosulfate sulfotransferase (PAPS reductase)/FAD synthetase